MDNNFYTAGLSELLDIESSCTPWDIIKDITAHLDSVMNRLDKHYKISAGIAVHASAVIENSAIIKAPAIIGEGCFVGANAYLRGGVLLGKGSRIGPGCEIKSCIILSNSAAAHFNFIGDSIVGNHVNFEAGAIVTNHFNERADKQISVWWNAELINTQLEKFGAVVGDYSKIGANAVLSPGTILQSKTMVKRLALVDQQYGPDIIS
jgi:UDP-N-acetylglucosamine diphosphorylase / glucose-1-phosphate thymidylyltransferase / UDP-N-acetylgalactosamine diphosphorylase / glucosamine-1-phosphate N-acetyltransferase / galactosamine-1-phosphate N-acetyltransferase